MELLQDISFYLAIGCLWTFFVEWSTTRGDIGPPWTNGERWLQCLLWPWFLIVFIMGWLDGIFGGGNTNND